MDMIMSEFSNAPQPIAVEEEAVVW
jgi:hypothetical protein